MVNSIMKTHHVILHPEDSIKDALSLLVDSNVNGAPVVDHNDTVVGMIVKADIYRFLMEEGHYDTCPVDWVMSKKVVTVTCDDDIIFIAKTIRENDIQAVPVIENGKITGVFTIEDIVDYFIEENK